jgi:replicative DNA helicase
VKTYHLADDFIDKQAERALLIAISQQPDLYWELLDDLSPGVFICEPETWKTLSATIEAEKQPQIPEEWINSIESGDGLTLKPNELALRLADLYQRRLLAQAQERLAEGLYATTPASELTSMLEEEAARIQIAIKETQLGRLLWSSTLMKGVMIEAETRRRAFLESGSSILGVTTGITKLDHYLNGLAVGLYILAGAPGVGKTTLSLQIAIAAAASKVPVIYVTYENSPANLTLKALCANARIPCSSVERGIADLTPLIRASERLEPTLSRLALIEGTSRLTLAQVRGKAFQALARHKAERCLIIFDYLQRASHTVGYDQMRYNVSALAGELRDMANRLKSPVVAISSQNRSSGDYGKGGGSANLDSLKESGDLEYSADVVMFLRLSDKRPSNPPAKAVDLVLAKNRFGDTGSVSMIFRPDLGELREEALM